MFDSEVFVCEGFGAVYAGATCAVAVQEVATLDHEARYLWDGELVDEDRWKGHEKRDREEDMEENSIRSA
jgi:hypothetical protein